MYHKEDDLGQRIKDSAGFIQAKQDPFWTITHVGSRQDDLGQRIKNSAGSILNDDIMLDPDRICPVRDEET